MRFKSVVHRTVSSLVAALALLAGCGGSTSPVQSYRPQRLIVFGDETSALVEDGNHNAFKYGVNGINATTNQRDCTVLPIWVQGLASTYGFVFAECNPGGLTDARALMRAQLGARVEDPTSGLAQQIAEQQASGLGAGDLVTLLIGGNDIVELFELVQSGQLSQPDAIVEARRRGGVTARLANQLLALDTRLIVVTVPDPGLSPFAIAAETLVAGSKTLLSNLTREYNAYLRTGIDSATYDGRNYGLVLGDDILASTVSSPTSYLTSPANVSDALCVVALPACTNAPADLAPDANVNAYVWADRLHVSPTIHNRLAASAISRVTTLPF